MVRGPSRLLTAVLVAFTAMQGALRAGEAPLQMVVMDPLALQLSCTCVEGTGQRRYDLLAKHLEQAAGRPVKVTFDESLPLALQRTRGAVDLIIGKDAMVRHDAAKASLAVRPLAALTDSRGDTQLRGVFLVRSDSALRKMEDLAGKRIDLGPAEDEETNAAARAAIDFLKFTGPPKWTVAGSIDAAAIAMSDGEVDASVVSAFLPPLLEGCGKLEKGSTRIIGETAGVPFIRVFAAASLDAAVEAKIVKALGSVAESPALLAALESKSGFVIQPANPWPDWRGPGRRGVVPQLPARLPARLPRIWSAALTGPPMAGAAAAGDSVIVPDKSADGKQDIFRCLGAADGRERWRLEYDAPADLEYTNAPRATPVIHDGLVYLQGALGHLHCVRLATGEIVWKRHLFDDFGAHRLTWGASVSPLIDGDRLIVAPGAKDASVVALELRTGAVLWKTPGHAAAYSAFVSGIFGGVNQIVGFDSAGVGGWDPATGRRLWEVIPPDGSDFHVTTPVLVGQQLLLAGENNATRLHRFDGNGRLIPEPVLKNGDLAPDTCTPAVARGRVFASAYGELFCLDLADGLRTIWRQPAEMFHDHSNIVASEDRILIWTASGDLLLLDPGADEYRPLSHLRPFEEKHPDSLAHPAFAGDRIYLRSSKELVCFRLGGG